MGEVRLDDGRCDSGTDRDGIEHHDLSSKSSAMRHRNQYVTQFEQQKVGCGL